MRKKIVTILVVLATIVLAGIAIYTSIRLYQLRQESVAPTAPESAPEAAVASPAAGEGDLTGDSGHCAPLTFTIVPKVPGLNCEDKEAYKNNSQNTPGNYVLSQRINPGSTVNRNQTFVYSIYYKNSGTKSVASAVIKDTLPINFVTFVDGTQGCTVTTQGNTTCNVGAVGVGATGRVSFRVKVKGNVPFETDFTNEATLDPIEGANSACSIALVTQAQGASPTPTSTATPGPTATPTEPPDEPTPTPTEPPDEPEPTPTPTPKLTPTPKVAAPVPTQEPSLPDAGVATPTLMGLGAGLIFLIIAMALAL